MRPEPDSIPRATAPLDEALRAAFGTSVLTTIEASAGRVPRVLLRPPAEADSPVVRPHGRWAEPVGPRYQTVGELARGGVGVILKARDVDLGRDVAVKVLREEHLDNPELLQRFVEEAQIGGQLQHPGIVPVYEIGLQGDARPYFTMKLVKGRTLAALLSGRADLAADRIRILGIFRQVCLTVAYAHARGVVHRDLKPANVMLGSFGEVQVVDWGFAKVLASGGVADEERSRAGPDISVIATVRSEADGSASLAGSVMGTPAYMPPEQAQGDVESLDERSDVFSLGAILCEVLTGKPPYAGMGRDLLDQAARADLQDAFQRIDRCGADAPLVEMTKRCLAPAKSARPRDAGVLAEALGDHLAAVEARARDAELRATQHRSRMRWSSSLGVLLLTALTLGWWADDQRRARIAHASRIARGAIEEAMLLRGKAAGNSTLSLAGWAQAASVASEALELAADADEETRIRAHELAFDIDRDAEAARRALAQERAERELLNRLTELRSRRGIAGEAGPQAFEAAFDAYGLDASRLRASAIRDEIVGALDDWGGAPEVLAEVDPDPWRSALRALGTTDAAALAALARPAAIEVLSVSSLLLLGDRLGRAGHVEGAIEVLRHAVERAPSDFWARYYLGWWCAHSGEPDFVEQAAEHLAAAVRERPDTLGVRWHLATVLEERNDLERALAEMRELVLRDAEFPGAASRLARLYAGKGEAWFARGEYSSAARAYEEAKRLVPEEPEVRMELARARREEGALDKALAEIDASIALEGTDPRAYYERGLVQAARQEHHSATSAFRRSIAASQEGAQRVTAQVYRRLSLSLEAVGDLDGAIQAMRRAAAAGTTGWGARSDYIALFRMIERRDGLDAAIESLEGWVAERPGQDWIHSSLARLYVRAGRLEEAEEAELAARSLLFGAIERDPQNGFHYLRLAYNYAHPFVESTVDLAEAERLLERGLSSRAAGIAHPSEHDQAYFQGPILYRLGDFDRAIEVLEGLGPIYGELQHAKVFLALSYNAAGRRQDALDTWNEIRDQTPDSNADLIETLMNELAQELGVAR